jgi:hypothetical protein
VESQGAPCRGREQRMRGQGAGGGGSREKRLETNMGAWFPAGAEAPQAGVVTQRTGLTLSG